MSIESCVLISRNFSCHSLKSLLEGSQGYIEGFLSPTLHIQSPELGQIRFSDLTTRIWSTVIFQKDSLISPKWSLSQGDLEVWIEATKELKQIIEKKKRSLHLGFLYERVLFQSFSELDLLEKHFASVSAIYQFVNENQLVLKAKQKKESIYIRPLDSGLQRAISVSCTGRIFIHFNKQLDPLFGPLLSEKPSQKIKMAQELGKKGTFATASVALPKIQNLKQIDGFSYQRKGGIKWRYIYEFSEPGMKNDL